MSMRHQKGIVGNLMRDREGKIGDVDETSKGNGW